jgi:hypothetical protein
MTVWLLNPLCSIYRVAWPTMNIGSVLFSGALDDQNNLELTIDETYLPIRSGVWLTRLDSLTVTVKHPRASYHIAVSSSLMQSPQEISLMAPPPNDVPLKRVKVMKPTPLHVFCLERSTLVDEKRSVLTSREGSWFTFNNATPRVELQFRDLDDLRNRSMGLTVYGILLFQKA